MNFHYIDEKKIHNQIRKQFDGFTNEIIYFKILYIFCATTDDALTGSAKYIYIVLKSK